MGVYKIGISTIAISKRYAGENSKIEILYTKEFNNGIEAYDMEQSILLKTADYNYIGKRLLKVGNTELRTVNLLQYI